ALFDADLDWAATISRSAARFASHSVKPAFPQTAHVLVSSYGKVLASAPLVVIHYFAEWNLHDHTLGRVLQPVRKCFSDRILFAAFDVEQPGAVEVTEPLGLVEVGAIACYRNGQLHELVQGLKHVPEDGRGLRSSDMAMKCALWLLDAVGSTADARL